jgi:hypothetical protein
MLEKNERIDGLVESPRKKKNSGRIKIHDEKGKK